MSAILRGGTSSRTVHIPPEDYVIEQNLKDDINEVLHTLSDKEREVVEFASGQRPPAMTSRKSATVSSLPKSDPSDEKSALKRLSQLIVPKCSRAT